MQGRRPTQAFSHLFSSCSCSVSAPLHWFKSLDGMLSSSVNNNIFYRQSMNHYNSLHSWEQKCRSDALVVHALEPGFNTSMHVVEMDGPRSHYTTSQPHNTRSRYLQQWGGGPIQTYHFLCWPQRHSDNGHLWSGAPPGASCSPVPLFDPGADGAPL